MAVRKKTTKKPTKRAVKKRVRTVKAKATSSGKKATKKKATRKRAPKKKATKAQYPNLPSWADEDEEAVVMLSPIKFYGENEVPEPSRDMAIGVANLLKEGVPLETAVGCFNVTKSTLQDWAFVASQDPKSDEARLLRVAYTAQCQGEVEDIRAINDLKKKFPSLLQFKLERRFSGRWGTKVNHVFSDIGEAVPQKRVKKQRESLEGTARILAFLEAAGALPAISGVDEDIIDVEAETVS